MGTNLRLKPVATQPKPPGRSMLFWAVMIGIAIMFFLLISGCVVLFVWSRMAEMKVDKVQIEDEIEEMDKLSDEKHKAFGVAKKAREEREHTDRKARVKAKNDADSKNGKWDYY